MKILPISYLELPCKETTAMKDFYRAVCGWSFEDFGPEYATVHGSTLEAGFNATGDGQPAGPLVVIESADIAATAAAVEAAGGTITVATFAYPGGRRFHFTDPAGNELAVMQPDSHAMAAGTTDQA